jgi:hypothetical protein
MRYAQGGLVVDLNRPRCTLVYGGRLAVGQDAALPVDFAPPETCHVCRRRAAVTSGRCSSCASIRGSSPGREVPPPPELVAEALARQREAARRHEMYARDRARRHALAGAIIFAIFGFVFACVMFCSVMVFISMEAAMNSRALLVANGTPVAEAAEVSPRLRITFGLFLAFVLSAALGAPTGYALSRLERGQAFAAFVGACAFSASSVVANMGNIAASDNPWFVLVLCAFLAAVPGGSAGHFLGYHIHWDG